MDFKEFFYQKHTISFEFQGVTVLIEELPITETAILGLDNTASNQGDKRYKVTFQAPKNSTQAHLGHYQDQTLYAVAPDPRAAKETVYNWLNHKFSTRKRHFEAKKRYMHLHAKPITTWKDLLELVQYLTNQRMNDNDRLTHFGKQEYDLLRQQSQQPNFFRTLATLTDKEQKLIKTLFKQLNTVPAQTKFGIKNLRPPKKQKELFPEPEPEKEKEETPPERSWSVYAPKTIKAADKLFKNNEDINSIQKVYKLANNFGITGKELRDYYLMEYHNQQTKYYHEDQAAYLHKWLRDKMGKNNRWNSPAIQEGDHASKAFSWDTLMRTLNSSGIDHPLVHAARNSSYADQSNYAHNNEASERLWYFYLAGPPEQTPIVARLFQALQEIVYPHYEQGQGYQRKKAVGYTFPLPNEDDLPF